MTNEEHINRLKIIREYCCAKRDTDSLDYAIKALEQEPKTDILEQIKAEINSLNNIDYVKPITVEEVLDIIDKAIKEQTT